MTGHASGNFQTSGFPFDKSLPLGRAKRACLCARLLAIFSAHRRTALLTMCFSSMCFGFTAKLGRRTAEAAHLCTFPLVCAHFRTLVHISALPVLSILKRNRIAVELDTPMPFPPPYFSGKYLSSFRIHRNYLNTNWIHPELSTCRLSAHVSYKLSRMTLSVWRRSANHSA